MLIQARFRVAIAACAVMLSMAFGAGSATANRSIEIGIPEEGRGTTTVSGAVSINGTELRASTGITCDITLYRTVTTGLPKVAGTAFGRVTGVQIDRGESRRSSCRGGEMVSPVEEITVLAERGRAGTHREDGRGRLLWNVSGSPSSLWALIYDSFQGTLPEITGLNFHIRGAQFQFRAAGFECLYRGELYGLVSIREWEVTRAQLVLERTRLSRDSGSIFCPYTTATLSATLTTQREVFAALLENVEAEVYPVEIVGERRGERLGETRKPIEIAMGETAGEFVERNNGGIALHDMSGATETGLLRYTSIPEAACRPVLRPGRMCNVVVERANTGITGVGSIRIFWRRNGVNDDKTVSVDGR